MNGSFNNEVLGWRLAGAAVWQALVSTTIYVCYECIRHPVTAIFPLRALGSIFNVHHWISVVSLLLALIPAAAAHVAVLSTVESPAKQRAGLQFLPAKVAVLFRKLAARATTPRAVVAWIMFLVAHIASAASVIYQTVVSSKNQFCKSIKTGHLLQNLFIPFSRLLLETFLLA